MAPGASDNTTFTGSYAITQADIDAGTFNNVAQACGLPPTGPVVCDDDPHDEPIPQGPVIDLDKTGSFQDESGDGFAQVGETISYAFTVTNTGNVTLTNVDITDLVGGVTVSGGPIASLAVGAFDNTTFTASYAITQADIDAGTFNNVAQACGLPPTGPVVCDDDPHDEPLLPAPPATDVGVLIIDEDSIDNGIRYWPAGVTPRPNNANFFSDIDVNDQIAAVGQRSQLNFFAENFGEMITLKTGQVGDEGWFAPQTIPSSWDSAGPTSDGLTNYIGVPGGVGNGLGAGNDPESLLDKIPDVTPLRATGLEALEGGTFCAIVYDSDVSINYDPLDGNLQGANLGIVAFEVKVDGVNRLRRFSSGTLPTVAITILDADVVCGEPLSLVFAPRPPSSSEPFDTDPENPTGGYQ